MDIEVIRVKCLEMAIGQLGGTASPQVVVAYAEKLMRYVANGKSELDRDKQEI